MQMCSEVDSVADIDLASAVEQVRRLS